MNRKFLLILAIILMAGSIAGSRESLMNRNEWEKLKDGHNYEEKLPEKKQRARKENTEPVNLPDLNFDNLLKVFAYVGIVTILLMTLYLIVWRMGLFDKINAKTKAFIYEEHSPEMPMENELKKSLNNALENNDFRLAIRLLYTLILIRMHERQWIIFSKDKTSGQYMFEIQESETRKVFCELIRVYERSWFGNFPLTRKEWETSFRLCQNILN
jgi:hypothetical protein